jgi:putative ATPase
MAIPLPERLRPKKLSRFVGQAHLVGKDGVITKLLEGAKREGFLFSGVLQAPEKQPWQE